MKYSIIGSGELGTAIARYFARSGISVQIANSRGPESIAYLTEELGAAVTPVTVRTALKAKVIILAVPFDTHQEIAENSKLKWKGKTIIDAMNYSDGVLDPRHLTSSHKVALSFPGAEVVRTFNQIPAAVLNKGIEMEGACRVMFVAGTHSGSTFSTGQLLEDLGFAALYAGRLDVTGRLLEADGLFSQFGSRTQLFGWKAPTNSAQEKSTHAHEPTRLNLA